MKPWNKENIKFQVQNVLARYDFQPNKHVSFDWICIEVSKNNSFLKAVNACEFSFLTESSRSGHIVNEQYRSLSLVYPVKSNQQLKLNYLFQRRYLKRIQWFLLHIHLFPYILTAICHNYLNQYHLLNQITHLNYEKCPQEKILRLGIQPTHKAIQAQNSRMFNRMDNLNIYIYIPHQPWVWWQVQFVQVVSSIRTALCHLSTLLFVPYSLRVNDYLNLSFEALHFYLKCFDVHQ